MLIRKLFCRYANPPLILLLLPPRGGQRDAELRGEPREGANDAAREPLSVGREQRFEAWREEGLYIYIFIFSSNDQQTSQTNAHVF